MRLPHARAAEAERKAISYFLDPGKAAYSDLAVLYDGTILCLYEADTYIVCARFNLEWVTAP